MGTKIYEDAVVGKAAEVPADLVAYNYCVSFIDLLGQRDALKGEALLPHFSSEDDRKKFNATLKGTIGAILALQDRADVMMAIGTKDSPMRASIPPEHRNDWDEMLRTRVHTQRWSDGLVSFVCLGDQEIKCHMNGIYNIIGQAGSLCLLGLASKHPLRGAIDVAWGVELRPGEIYGASVARAYELESEVAQYPRIVVSDRIIRFLEDHIAHPGQDIFSENNRELAKLCHSMLIRDADGVCLVHYLGDEFQQAITRGQHAYLYSQAMTFVLEQLKTYQASKNSKLAFRYVNLLNYFEAHPIQQAESHK